MNNTRAKLIATLRLRTGAIVPYAQLVDSIWGHDPLGGPLDPLNVIKVCTCALRKLGAPIVTQKGVGLMWNGTVGWVQPGRVPGLGSPVKRVENGTYNVRTTHETPIRDPSYRPPSTLS